MSILRLSIIICTLFSAIIAQNGCMDMEACNYDIAATQDCDGNEAGSETHCCEYTDYEAGECDCEGSLFDCSGVCGGNDFSSCMTAIISELGWYDNDDCSGNFYTSMEGVCEGNYDGPPIIESECESMGGFWLSGGCWEESIISCTEWYDDFNGNGMWDDGESFDDNNGDQTWTAGYTQEECENSMNGVYVEDDWGCTALCINYVFDADMLTAEECWEMDDSSSSEYDWVHVGDWVDDPDTELPIFYFYEDGTVAMTCDMDCTFDSQLTEQECSDAGGDYDNDSECEFDTELSEEECEVIDGDADWSDDGCEVYDESTCNSLGGTWVEDYECNLESEGSCTTAGGTWSGGQCIAGMWDECGIDWSEDADFPPLEGMLEFDSNNNFIGFSALWGGYGETCIGFTWLAYQSDGITIEACDDGDGPPECLNDCAGLDTIVDEDTYCSFVESNYNEDGVSCWDDCDDMYNPEMDGSLTECGIDSNLSNDMNTPYEFGVSNIYPNPFNPTTQISFNIVEYSHVELDILDVSGRVIDQLDQSFYSPGSYIIDYNASKHSSGLYFVRLKSSSSTSIYKMMLMK